MYAINLITFLVIYSDFSIIFYILKEAWQAIVAFVIPAKVHDELYIEQLEKTTKIGRRRKFTWITKKDLIDQVFRITLIFFILAFLSSRIQFKLNLMFRFMKLLPLKVNYFIQNLMSSLQ